MGMGSVISLHHQNIEGCFAQLGFGPLGKMEKGEFPQAIDMQNHDILWLSLKEINSVMFSLYHIV